MTIDCSKLSIEEYKKITSSPLLKKKKDLIATPAQYLWAEKAWETQQELHWLHSEVPMHTDCTEWQKLTDGEKSLLKKIFLFFTQIEVEINQEYTHTFAKIIEPFELKKMFICFANMETIHSTAYSYLISSLFSEEEQKNHSEQFLNYKEIKNKYDTIQSYSLNNMEDLFVKVAVFGVFIEGIVLFASFAILLFFPNIRKSLRGMGQIISYAMRDETIHIHSMVKLFLQLKEENQDIWNDNIEKRIYEEGKKIVQLEIEFIDFIFTNDKNNQDKSYQIDGLNPDDLKKYIYYKGNVRFQQLNMKSQFDNCDNPLKWMDNIGASELANFFETSVIDYKRWTNISTTNNNLNKDNWASTFK